MQNTSLMAACAMGLSLFAEASAFGQAVHFSRLTDTIRINGDTNLGTTYTIEAMIKLDADQTGAARVWGEQRDGQEDKSLSLNSSFFGGGIWNGACTPAGLSFSGPISVGVWHHVAFVRDGSSFSLYRDGVQIATGPAPCSSSNADSSTMAIGAFPYIVNGVVVNSFLGTMDWLRVSSVARYAGPFATTPTCEPAPYEIGTLLLFRFNHPYIILDEGPNHFPGTAGAGFLTATAPELGVAGRPSDMESSTQIISAAACDPSGAEVYVETSGYPTTACTWQIETSSGQWLTLSDTPAALPCGGNASNATASPANSPSTTVRVHGCAGVFNVRCIAVTDFCGTTTSAPARIFVNAADIGRSGGLPGSDGLYDNNDFIAFISEFFARHAAADLGRAGGELGNDGQFNNNDFIAFINQFFVGC